MAAGQAGPSKYKNTFTNSYCAYHRFYEHSTEDWCDIQTLAEQRTQKKDRASSRGSRDRNSYHFDPRRCIVDSARRLEIVNRKERQNRKSMVEAMIGKILKGH
ncbi:hypothetical protein Fot_47609 [Forsythia ovata]|uniref:Uncharacterized protein n=1 Tax=Forsythia ovata TaxID=205694 RepID=A0ABD1QQV3_9LAMI